MVTVSSKRSIGLVALALGLWFGLTACGLSPEALCKKTLELTCKKIHECTDDSKKDENFKKLWGNDPSDCQTKLESDRTIKSGPVTITISGMNCNNRTEETACENSKQGNVYHPEKGQECLQEWEKMTCEQIFDSKGSLQQPSPCKEICQSS